jgi:perosamine synthetase
MVTVTKRDVPLARPSITEEEIEVIGHVLRSGWLAHGEYNHKFEHAFAEYLGVKHAISMNSCTSALEAAIQVPGITGEVIIPSFTWVATANVVVLAGATPVFCDVDEATRNLTAELIAEKITPNTQAVIVVHYGGQPCQLDDIIALCEKHNLLLIEDSAETLGATWKGRQAGSMGIGCFSFFPTKNITTAEGGMFTTNDDDIARKTRAWIAHGVASTTMAREKVERPWLRAAEMPGHNYRMPNPLAALGYHQLLRVDEMNAKRIELGQRYDELLAELTPEVITPKVADGATHVYQMYTVQVEAAQRNDVLNKMRANGVGASAHFDPPVHLQPYYVENYGGHVGQFPATESLANTLITLPIFPDMTFEDQDWVVHALREALGR